jgi:single-stranded-DNA-specific exonuclease
VTVEPEWVQPTPDSSDVRRLASELECSTVLARVLVSRGYTEPSIARDALDPSVDAIVHPSALPDLQAAVARLASAVDGDESIGLFADRDVDGITGCAILQTLLEDHGANVRRQVPGKYDGYGIDEPAVEDFVDAGVDLLVAVDCGTTAYDAIERARSAGIDVVVIDHHDPDNALPETTACVNPRCADSEYPNPDLAAGALAWKVGQAFVEERDPGHLQGYHRRALPLAAIATLGDHMALTVENRAIVREGFSRLQDCDLPGVVQTAGHCDVETTRDVGWSLVPLLNAAQEDASGEFMLELLLARDRDRIDAKIDQLEDYREDRRRQRAERLAHLETCIDEQIDPEHEPVIFVQTEEYVGGGAMSELSSRWYKPIVTYRPHDDGFRGGARTKPDVDLLELYGECDDLLDEYWGHPGAAGFRIPEANLEAFESRFTDGLTERYDVAELRPTLDVDVTVDPGDLDRSVVSEIERFGPYGSNHDEPIVLLEAVELADTQWFGADDAHWKGRPADADDIVCIDWNGDEVSALDLDRGPVDVAGTLGIDDYDDWVRVTVEAMRPAGE